MHDAHVCRSALCTSQSHLYFDQWLCVVFVAFTCIAYAAHEWPKHAAACLPCHARSGDCFIETAAAFCSLIQAHRLRFATRFPLARLLLRLRTRCAVGTMQRCAQDAAQHARVPLRLDWYTVR